MSPFAISDLCKKESTFFFLQVEKAAALQKVLMWVERERLLSGKELAI